ncbi:hypothetical protein KA047_02090 [Candidatus Saccharibacteria bacterium]|nr:hypothetical protein [Candidatus Saccharibacteria bacterium]
MLKSNESLDYTDLIRPLSLEAVEYFASGDIPLAASYDSPLLCKFIRYGEVMMIGTAIDFGKPDYRGRRACILHINLFETLQMNDEAFSAAQAVAEAEPFSTGGTYIGVFNDGGYAEIGTDGTSPVSLILRRDSYDFGRADEQGRLRSIEVAQQLVGDTIAVSAED